MSISFFTIPLNLNAPGAFAEFDASGAVSGLAGAAHDSLVIGQMLTGSATPGTLSAVESVDEAAALFGRDSQVAQMCAAFKAANPAGNLYAIGLADAGSGVAATGKFMFSGTATESREMVLYVAGRRIAIPVAKGDTATAIETAALAAFNDLDSVAANVVGDAGTGVDLTAVNKGTIGNQIMLGHSCNAGERLPLGITVTITPMSGGQVDPSYAPAITAIADEQYATIATGLVSGTNIGLLTGLLSDRWEGTSSKDGHLFGAYADTRPNLTTLGNSFNSEQFTLLGLEPSAKLRAPWEVAAALAGLQAKQTVIDPALHMRGVQFPTGFSGPKRGESFTYSQRDTLLTDGVSTEFTGADGSLNIDRLITTWQTNSLGFIDKAYQDLTSKRTLSFLRYSLLARVSSKFGRVKIVSDTTTIPAGSNCVSPKIIEGEIIALFGEWQQAGLVENADQFVSELVVERDPSDPNRVNALIPPDLVNNLLSFAARIAFKR